MNRRQMRERVSTYLSIPAVGDGMLTPDRLNGFIDDGLSAVSTDQDWPYLLTSATVSFDTTGTAAVPAGFSKARDLVIGGHRAKLATFREYLDQDARSDTFVWTVVGSNLKIDPEPTATLAGTLWYFQAEPTLNDDTDTPLMSADSHQVVCAFAAHLGWLARGDQQRAQTWYAEFEQARKRMTDDLYQTYGPRSVVVRRVDQTWASWS